MEKLKGLRNAVNATLMNQKDAALQSEGWAHLYGVSQTASLLAHARALDSDLCAAAGLLHDIYAFRTGEETEHALHGSMEAADMLRAARWPEGEVGTICGMICNHSDKRTIGTPLEECLKDADVLAHWLFDRAKEQAFNADKKRRLAAIKAELGLR